MGEMQQRIGTQLVAVFLGGLLGGGIREVLMLGISWHQFPLNTLVVNLTGVFLTVLVTTRICHRWHTAKNVHEFIDVGILGAYTTYGTVVLDIATHPSLIDTTIYLLVTVFGSVMMVYLARYVGRGE